MLALIFCLLPSAALAQNGMCSDCGPPTPPMAGQHPIMVHGGVMGGANFGVPMAPPNLMLPPLMMGMFGGGMGGGRGGGGGGGRGGGEPIMEAHRSPQRTRPNRKNGRRGANDEEFAGIQRPRTIAKTDEILDEAMEY